MDKLIKAKKLKQNSVIGFYSPSAPVTAFAPKRFLRSKKYLEKKGFILKEGMLTNKSNYYRSGTIKKRAEELNELIRNPEVRLIISTIGGTNSNSILPFIDYEALRKDPKIIIGYSDVTAILLGIYAKTGLVTFYGPALVASFGELKPFIDEIYDNFCKILIKSNKLPFSYIMPKFFTEEFINWEDQKASKNQITNKWITVIKGKAIGRLIGGNLNTMQGFWGSEYMPEIKKGDILFIEDSLKDAATIERSFSFLKVNGVFEKISGIILGKHELFNDRNAGLKPYEILLEVLNGKKIPFLAEFDCSHTHPMFTLPIGIKAELDATNKTVKLLEEWLL